MPEMRLSSQRVQVDVADAIEAYFERGWTDGLPVVPATEEKVLAFLAVAGLQPDKIVGNLPTRGQVITAEKVAINAVMAGCKPEYMPVVTTIVEAITQPEFNYHGVITSAGGSAPLILIGGPVAKRLGVNGGVNAFGPGWRANSTIGRAIRLIAMNVTGSIPGILDRSTQGHGGKYAWCFAENIEHSPWPPYHTERGFRADESTVTVIACQAPLQISSGGVRTPEALLNVVADNMCAVGPFGPARRESCDLTPSYGYGVNFGEFVVVFCPEKALILKQAGWSRRQTAHYLFERALGSISGKASDQMPIVSSPEGIMLLVAGAEGGEQFCVIPPWANGNLTRSVTRRIPMQ